MVLPGMTYEAPSYLPLPPFRARPPFCSPQLYPSSYIDSCFSLSILCPLFLPHPSPAALLFFTFSPPVFHSFSQFTEEPLCSYPHPSCLSIFQMFSLPLPLTHNHRKLFSKFLYIRYSASSPDSDIVKLSL